MKGRLVYFNKDNSYQLQSGLKSISVTSYHFHGALLYRGMYKAAIKAIAVACNVKEASNDFSEDISTPANPTSGKTVKEPCCQGTMKCKHLGIYFCQSNGASGDL